MPVIVFSRCGLILNGSRFPEFYLKEKEMNQEMKLGKLFSDGAVIQRRQFIPVWGETAPGSVVKATLAGVSAFGASSSNGDFLFRLPPIEQAGGPHTLVVENLSNGEKIEVRDILIGEVWLASGQSNMGFTMGSSPDQLEEFLAENHDPSTLRMLTVGRSATSAPQDSFEGEWLYSDAQNTPAFSAVALWFGSKLRERLGVPVGIIASSWGGTIIEAWTSRNTLIRNPDVASAIQEYEQRIAGDAIWKAADVGKIIPSRFGAEVKGDPGNKGEGFGWAKPEFDDSAWVDFNVPGFWTSEGLAGNGAVWIRREFELPVEWAGKDLILELGGIDKHDVTYFNGVQVGATGKGFEEAFCYSARKYTVPGRLVSGGKAMIAIRAFSFLFDGSFNGDALRYRIYPAGCAGQAVSLAGTWKFGVEADFGKVPCPTPRTAAGPNVPNTWSILFDGMIRPLIPYAIRGAIWYQGESNAGTVASSAAYQRLMADMINDWRFCWGQGDFPFHMVQLANFRTPCPYDAESPWAVLRESQRRVCEQLPGVGMAVAVDCGEAADIHPKDKRSVGFRLAYSSLYNDYGCEDVVPGGPLPKQTVIENGAVRVRFEHAQGLHFDGSPRGFYLAGGDGEFFPADSVEIDGSSVVLRSSKILRPVHVRYSWSDNPDGNLYNNMRLPASPFEA